jgi:hypothetical protein
MPLKIPLGKLLAPTESRCGGRSYGRIVTLVTPIGALLFIIGAAILQLAILGHVQATGPVPLRGTLSPLLAHSRLTGRMQAQQRISLSIGLLPRNKAALDTYAQNMWRPGSSNYRRFLIPAQFSSTFGPTQADYDGLRLYLENEGFTITHTYNHHLLIVFSGSVEQVERVFHVVMNTYLAPDGRVYYAHDREPVLPAYLAKKVQGLYGLSDGAYWHHSAAASQKLTLASGQAGSRIACPGPGKDYLLPDQVRAAYNLSALHAEHIRGEGQTIALFELNKADERNLQAYTSCFGGTQTALEVIRDNTVPFPENVGSVEATMDAEIVLSAAPRLNTLKIYEASNHPTAVLAQWAQIVQDAPSIVSTGWSVCEQNIEPAFVQQEHLLFTAAVVQGQNIFAATGDSGSAGCIYDGLNMQVGASDPAVQPFVTAVGGTTLLTHSSAYREETVWNTTTLKESGAPNAISPPIIQNRRASGGGISRYWTAPAWQNAPGVRNNYSAGNLCDAPTGAICRETPDVALHADTKSGYLVYCTTTGCDSKHPWLSVGGSSAAAPLWAAQMALTNQLSFRRGGSAIGFVNPLLYQLASSTKSYEQDFHDVLKGHNDVIDAKRGLYPATPGYDMATGLGSYNAFNLARDLVALNMQGGGRVPVHPTWYFAEGSVGNGFQEFLILHNPDPLQDAEVTITYLFQERAPLAVRHKIARNTRATVNINDDVRVRVQDRPLAVSSIVRVIKGSPGVIAERPMYFTYRGIRSGTNAMGATAPATSYYFPTVDTRQQGRSYRSFLAILNPNPVKSATVTVTYYTGNCGLAGQEVCQTQKIVVPPLYRSTISPEGSQLRQQMTASVRSELPVVVERSMYVIDKIDRAGGVTTGATTEVGATTTARQWLFAEGYTGRNFQQYVALANFATRPATARILLRYDNGHWQEASVTVPALGRTLFDVNAATEGKKGGCDTRPCQTTMGVTTEVTSDIPLVAERLLYFHFGKGNYSGVAATIGEAGPPAHTVYAFAEGHTGKPFQQYLTLYNPTDHTEEIIITLYANMDVMQRRVTLKAYSRQTLDINAWLVPLVTKKRLGSDSYAASLVVQTQKLDDRILAERALYFNYRGSQGGSIVAGYGG